MATMIGGRFSLGLDWLKNGLDGLGEWKERKGSGTRYANI